ncbi:MAG: hypothetical protein V1885_01515 [Candidatus Brennerbacteria bacterium]
MAKDARLINHEFPWLWAIRNVWCPGFADIKVANAETDANLTELLGLPHSSHIQVWVRYGADGTLDTSCSHVVMVKYVPDYAANWALRILETVPVGYPVNNVVTTRPSHETNAPDEIRIYRAKLDPHQTFNEMLVKIAHP